MSNFPVRDMGSAGVIADVSPYNLPTNVVSSGVNVRFENGNISRSPVLRRIYEFGDDGIKPAYAFSIPAVANGGNEAIVVVRFDYHAIYSVVGDTVTDLTPSPIPENSGLGSWTNTFLGNVAYLNNRSDLPYMKRPSDSTFQTLTAWDDEWRTESLRAYKDFLIALNVTKGATSYPTMVKWSDIAAFGGPPPSWDETSTTNSAGENIINEMQTPIIDGLSLRDSFIIYGASEVWLMNYIGGNLLFQFRKLFDATGIISQNCVTEVEGLHYVFGSNDIYVNDGASKRSIAHGRVKDFIFDNLVRDQVDKAFVAHNPSLNEILFCYPSSDAQCSFTDTTIGCNRAAVYNYRRDLWSFVDLPNLVSACEATVSGGQTYDSLDPTPYTQLGGSYASDEDDQDAHVVFVGQVNPGQGISGNRVYGYDLAYGGRLNRPVETELLRPAFIERVGIDIDEEGIPLTAYKVIQAFYPQIGVTGQGTVDFQFGASDILGQEPTWGPRITYDPSVDNRVDNRESGRYLAYRMYHQGTTDFAFSGLDAKVTERGRR